MPLIYRLEIGPAGFPGYDETAAPAVTGEHARNLETVAGPRGELGW